MKTAMISASLAAALFGCAANQAPVNTAVPAADQEKGDVTGADQTAAEAQAKTDGRTTTPDATKDAVKKDVKPAAKTTAPAAPKAGPSHSEGGG